MANQASNYLNGGVVPRRLSNQHPNVVPYQDFATAEGNILVALGNDHPFRDLCRLIGRDDLGTDPQFADSAGRSMKRDLLVAGLSETLSGLRSADLLARMERVKLRGGPVNRVDRILADSQVSARRLIRTLHRDDGTPVQVLGFPVQLSKTPATYPARHRAWDRIRGEPHKKRWPSTMPTGRCS